MPVRRDWLCELAVAAGYLLLALLFCAPALRATYFHNDFESYYLPVRAWWAAGLYHGVLRWWCAMLGAGHPMFADSQVGAAYFGNLLFSFVRPAWLALSWTVILHFAWGGWGVYTYLRLLGLRRLSAWCGGVVFLCSAPVACRPVHLSIFQGIVWLPWLVVGLELAARGPGRRRRWGVLLAAFSLACSIATGHPQAPMLVLLTAVCYGCGRGWQLGGWRGAVGRGGLGAVAVVVLVGGWLAAVQIVPLLELLSHTVRGDGLLERKALEMSLEPAQFSSFVLGANQGRLTAAVLGWGDTPHWEWCPYVGVLPLFLAGAAMAGKRRERWLLGGLALLTLLLAMGHTLPFYGWLSKLPLWSKARGPARLLGLFAFSLASLVALNVDDWTTAPPSRRLRLRLVAVALAVSGLTFAAGWFYLRVAPALRDEATAFRQMWLRAMLLALMTVVWLASAGCSKHRLWRYGVALWLLLDVASGTFGYAPLKPPDYYAPPPEVATVTAVPDARMYVPVYQPNALQACRHLLYPGVANFGSYTPLALQRWTQVDRVLWDGLPNLTPGAANWSSLLRLRWTTAGILDPSAAQPGALVDLALRSPQPPAWVASRAIVAGSPEEALALTCRADFDPAEVVLEQPAPELPTQTAEAVGYGSDGQRVSVELNGRGGGVLVVGQTGYPGWRAWIDGRPAAAQVGDFLLTAVPLPIGAKQVALVYQPLTIRLGLWLSLLALATVAGFAVAVGRSPR